MKKMKSRKEVFEKAHEAVSKKLIFAGRDLNGKGIIGIVEITPGEAVNMMNALGIALDTSFPGWDGYSPTKEQLS